MSLVTLVFFSQHNNDRDALYRNVNEIVLSAAQKNEEKEITGALIFDERHYVQVLEGELDVVWSTFLKVRRDERHSNVGFVEMEAVPERYFANWRLGVTARDRRTDLIFAPYLRGGRFEPGSMTGIELVSLLVDLRKSLV